MIPALIWLIVYKTQLMQMIMYKFILYIVYFAYIYIEYENIMNFIKIFESNKDMHVNDWKIYKLLLDDRNFF